MDLLDAIINQDSKEVNRLLGNNADPNACDDHAKVSPLHYAAQGGSLEIFKVLVAAGADINAKTEEGDTPLDVAILHKHDDVIDFIGNV